MIDLTHPDLRTRDILHILSLKERSLVWDHRDPDSEWEYASLETDIHRDKVLAWLRSKEVDERVEFIIFDESKIPIVKREWGYLLQKPEDFFGPKKFRAIATDLSWQLEYDPLPIVRFGRWPVSP